MFLCSTCGHKSIKWLGKCPVCNSWESFNQEDDSNPQESLLDFPAESKPERFSEIKRGLPLRITTDIEEFDRILGGGMVEGEVVLVGGEPGVGKSTLLLQIGGVLSEKNNVLYVSGEESCQQVAMRAKRLGVDCEKLFLLGADNILNIYNHINDYKFNIVIIDSIQVIYYPKLDSFRGSLNQVRGCAEFFTRMAKLKGVIFFIIGHVTKGGLIAGPKLMEHIVDCVLYFEPEITSNYRILRSIKNRFGSTGEIAVFEMTSSGLKEVKVLSDIFLPHKEKPVAGSSIACVVEGLKPLLIELQSLVCQSSFGVVRRRSLGFDFNRFSLLVAIIEKRLKVSLVNQDVFLNVAGGIRITDPAADLAAICAILSSCKEKEMEDNTAFIGEVGLAGELRPVSNINLRLKEVEKGGFRKCFIPDRNFKDVDRKLYSFDIVALESVKEIADLVKM
ncbi:MAG: DNA repair protein RadA [Candidatus Omnitrophota bacterium]